MRVPPSTLTPFLLFLPPSLIHIFQPLLELTSAILMDKSSTLSLLLTVATLPV